VQLITFAPATGAQIREFESTGASVIPLAGGEGEAHVSALSFEPGGRIGPHPAEFGQLLVPLTGSGWAAGADGVEFPLEPGQAAYFAPGEVHSKGSETGMTALMIQVRDLAISSPSRATEAG
jgi:quercetin dioxygenase-like cupin family protein